MATIIFENLDETQLPNMVSDPKGPFFKVIQEGSFKAFEAANHFYTIVSVDKAQITADGTDTATITASIYDYEDTQQNTDNTTQVVFEVTNSAGTTQTVTKTAVNGVATMTLTSANPDTYTIRTNVNGDYLNGQTKVVAA